MYIIQTNCGTKTEVEKISEALLQKHLVACVNYWQLNSMYWWENKICREGEWRLFIKTIEAKSLEVINEIKALHTYNSPIIWGYEATNDDLVDQWLAQNII